MVVKHAQKGLNLTETLVAASLVGVISVVSFVVLSKNNNETGEQVVVQVSGDVQKIFHQDNATNGLTLREIGPSAILDRHFKVQSQAANNIPSGCSVIGDEDIKVSTTEMGKVYSPEHWTLVETRNDYADLCIVDSQDKKYKILRVYRGGAQVDSQMVASTADVAPSVDTSTNTPNVNTPIINNDVDINMTVDNTMTPAVTVQETTLDFDIYSENTNLPIGNNRFSFIDLSANCGGSTYTIRIAGGQQPKMTLQKDTQCLVSVTSAGSAIADAVFSSGTPTLVDTSTSGSKRLNVLDAYTLKINGAYELPSRTVQARIVLTGGNGINASHVASVNSMKLIYVGMFPASNNPITVKFENAGAYNNISPESRVVNLATGPKTETITLTPDEYLSVGRLLPKDDTWDHWFSYFSTIFGSLLTSFTDGVSNNWDWSKDRPIIKAALMSKSTKEITYSVPYNKDDWERVVHNGKSYGVHKVTGQIRYYQASRTPVKINLSPTDAVVNSDDKFMLDTDGFASTRVYPLKTPGGLNANEAWLVLDRDNDGTWVNNTLDDTDLFGDHGARVEHGYMDLANTFFDEIKTDAKGNRYLDLTNYSPLGELQLWFTRTVLGDKKHYAAYDLKLFKRDRSLANARDVLNRVYVDSRSVSEYDRMLENAILQRAWVQYKNGQFHQSGDQYFFFFTGEAHDVTGKEAEDVQKAYLKMLKQQGRQQKYGEMKQVFEKVQPPKLKM